MGADARHRGLSEIPAGPEKIQFLLVVCIPYAESTKNRMVDGIMRKRAAQFSPKASIVDREAPTIPLRQALSE